MSSVSSQRVVNLVGVCEITNASTMFGWAPCKLRKLYNSDQVTALYIEALAILALGCSGDLVQLPNCHRVFRERHTSLHIIQQLQLPRFAFRQHIGHRRVALDVPHSHRRQDAEVPPQV